MPSVLGTLLAHIPWGQVVEHAPKLAQGATRLWERVRSGAEPPPVVTPEAGSEPVATPQARLAALEAQVLALQDEMRTSAGLVKELAEQNARLVERMQDLDRQHQRLRWLGGLALAALVAALLVMGRLPL
jgi:hypothetical protein